MGRDCCRTHPPEAEHRILLCGGVPCTSLGCKKVKEALEQELESNGLKEQVPVKEVGCIGDCSLGPSLIVYPEGIIYYRLRPEDAATIVREHIIQGEWWKSCSIAIPTRRSGSANRRRCLTTAPRCGWYCATAESYLRILKNT